MSENPVLLVHWGRTGGGPRFLRELAAACGAAWGDRVAVSYNADADIADGLRAVAGRRLEVRTYSSRLGVVLGLPRLVRTALRLRRWLRREGVTTVVGTMESVYQSLALPLAVPRSVRYVVCVHDAAEHPGEEHLVKRIGRRLELWRADAVVTFSGSVTEALGRQGALAGKQVVQSVHPAYDAPETLVRGRSLPTDRPPVVGFFGRLLAYKGLGLLRDAARLLREQGVAADVRIHGDGPEGAGRSGRDGDVTWHVGWVDDADVARTVASFDVLALPYVEASQSGPLAQATALGVPAVVTPVGGLREQAEASACAVVASAVDAEAFARAVAGLLGDPERYRRLSRAGIAAASGDLSWARLVRDLAPLVSAAPLTGAVPVADAAPAARTGAREAG